MEMTLLQAGSCVHSAGVVLADGVAYRETLGRLHRWQRANPRLRMVPSHGGRSLARESAAPAGEPPR